MQVKDRGYLLHLRPYRETSAIADIFTSRHGVIAGVIKGVYQQRKAGQQLRSALQPANELDLVWLDKPGLKSVRQLQPFSHHSHQIEKPSVFLCIGYINELTLRLIAQEHPCTDLFQLYQQVLSGLLASDEQSHLEHFLRVYEWAVLSELGVTPSMTEDHQHAPIKSSGLYQMHPAEGWYLIPLGEEKISGPTFSGELIGRVATGEWEVPAVARATKGLYRILIDHALQGKQLKSRELYRQMLSP